MNHLIERREDGDHVLLAVAADGIEMLETESNRIDEAVAGSACLVGQVDTQPLAVGHRLLVGRRRQHGVHTRWGRGNDLTQKVLAHKNATFGGRGVRGLAGKGEKGRLAHDAGALRIGGEVHARKLLRGRPNAI